MTFRKLSAPRAFVYHEDGALDRDAADFTARWDEYLESGDFTVLPLRPGCELTIFYIAPLTAAQAAHVENLFAEGARILSRLGTAQIETVAYGVVDVKAQVIDDAGNVAPFKIGRVKSDIGLRLDDESLNLIAGDDVLRRALWLAIKRASKLAPEARKSDSAGVVGARAEDG